MSATPASAIPQQTAAEQSSRSRRADTLAEGILLLLSCTVLQRCIGFLRGILFCRWLSPEELGYWDLSFNFILLAAPLVVIGIPGSFGRYIEYYRQQGQLSVFLRRTTLVCLALTACGCVTMFFCRQGISWLLFGDTTHEALALILAISLIAVIAFNFLDSLFAGLRQMRVVSAMQFTNSLLFAVVGMSLLCLWRPTALSVVIAYSLACLITTLCVMPLVRGAWAESPANPNVLGHRALWSKLIPFATWVWATNVLANVFIMADRYMIIHFGGFDSETAAGLLGNYHCSRVIPLLMVAVCGLLGDVVLPHLSHDWEAGRQRRVSDRLNLMLKVLSMALTTGGVAILTLAPWIFNWLLDGKYAGGLSVLPWTTIGCIWFGLCMVAQNYLWCAERAGQVSLMYAAGLALNIGLNFLLLPVFGLLGAVVATAVAMGLSLLLVYGLSCMKGMEADRGILIFGLLPLTLCCGPWIAGVVTAAVLVVSLRSPWLIREVQRNELLGEVKRYLTKLKPSVT